MLFLGFGRCFWAEDRPRPMSLALDKAVEVAPGESPMEPRNSGVAYLARFGHGPELHGPDAEIGCGPL